MVPFAKKKKMQFELTDKRYKLLCWYKPSFQKVKACRSVNIRNQRKKSTNLLSLDIERSIRTSVYLGFRFINYSADLSAFLMPAIH